MKKILLAVAAALFLMAVNLYAAPGDVSVDGYLYMPNRPAFSVTLSNNWTAAGVIKFDQIIVNKGSCYNSTTGRFKAPIAGLYQFCFGGIEYPDNGYSRADIWRNGAEVAGGRVYSNAGTEYDGSFKCIILELDANDYVEVYNNPATTGQGWYKTPWALFSGHLL